MFCGVYASVGAYTYERRGSAYGSITHVAFYDVVSIDAEQKPSTAEDDIDTGFINAYMRLYRKSNRKLQRKELSNGSCLLKGLPVVNIHLL